MNRAHVAILFCLIACSSEQKAAPTTTAPPATSATPTAPTAPTASSEPAPTPKPRRKEGEMCGGIAGLRCEDGLDCVIPEPMHPDKSGKCQKH